MRRATDEGHDGPRVRTSDGGAPSGSSPGHALTDVRPGTAPRHRDHLAFLDHHPGPPGPPGMTAPRMPPVMRRRLNLKLLVVLLIAASLLGGGVHLVHGFQEQRNVGALLKRADLAERKGDVGGAEKYLGRYLAFRPDDGAALA